MEQNSTDHRQAVLKTSFIGGFDKKEVLAYIDRLREENAASQTALDQKLQEVTSARNELSEQVTGFEKKLSEMGSQLDERSGRIRELTGEIERLKGELGDMQKTAAETGRALALQKEQNRILTERAEQSEERARRYDDVSAQLRDIFLTARQSAGELVGAAQEEASRIRSDAVCAGDRLTKELSSMRGELTQMRERMSEMVESFSNKLDGVEEILDELEQRSSSEKAAEDPDGEDAVARVMRELDQKRANASGSFLSRFRHAGK